MPAPLSVNREECLKTFLATGSLKSVSDLHGVPYNTIKQWAKRYSWPTANRLVTTIKESEEQLATFREVKGESVTRGTATEALEEHIATSTKVFRTGMATALQRIGETAGSMDGLTALENARKLKDSADIAKTVLGIGQDNTGASLQVNLLTLSLDNIIKPVQAIEI
jgi:hypothetical protein